MADENRKTTPFNWDIGYRSLNHVGEELCGDRVQIVETDHSRILILADGMGSGVKANIFSTLTSTILATMFREGATIDEALTTILSTLPICQERNTAYCTFTLLEVDDDRNAYLIDYDNPDAIMIRNGEIYEPERVIREIEGKTIKEARFTVEDGDTFAMMSDGCIWCSADEFMNFNWNRDTLAGIVKRSSRISPNARRIAFDLVQACDDEYRGNPADDTTAACMRICTPHTLKIMTGPPRRAEDDERIVADLLADDENGEDCTRIVCGGTSAKIVSRITGRSIHEVKQDKSKTIPPYDEIDGIDLTTEGVITMKAAIDLLEMIAGDPSKIEEMDMYEFDEDNGAALLATAVLEDCTHLELLVGQAVNDAYAEDDSFAGMMQRHELVKKLIEVAKKLGKIVKVTYY